MKFDFELFKTGMLISCSILGGLLVILLCVFIAGSINSPEPEEMNVENATAAGVISTAILFVLMIYLIK